MTTMRVVGECFFWYRLTRVFPDKFHRAVKRLCVCVCLRETVHLIVWLLVWRYSILVRLVMGYLVYMGTQFQYDGALTLTEAKYWTWLQHSWQVIVKMLLTKTLLCNQTRWDSATRGIQKVCRMIQKDTINFIATVLLVNTIYHSNIAQLIIGL